jgi:hypothetical protein
MKQDLEDSTMCLYQHVIWQYQPHLMANSLSLLTLSHLPVLRLGEQLPTLLKHLLPQVLVVLCLIAMA